jgi:hypothetical protein
LTKHTLPFGTRNEIESEIRETIANAGKGGGLIMARNTRSNPTSQSKMLRP